MPSLRLFGVSCLAALACAAHAGAAVLTLSAADNAKRAASATFTISGSNLYLTVANTSASDLTLNAEVLNAVFFKLPSTVNLTPVSAVLTSGSTVTNMLSQPSGGVVGGEWAYAEGLTISGGSNRGVSTAGYNLFGQCNFPGANLDGNTAVQGNNFGLVSAGDNPSTGQGQIPNTYFIKSSIDFAFSGLPSGFSLDSISNVQFQYGTSLNDVRLAGAAPPTPPVSPGAAPVPEPTAATAAAISSLALLARRRRPAA